LIQFIGEIVTAQILSILVLLGFGIPIVLSDLRTKQVSNSLSVGFFLASATIAVFGLLTSELDIATPFISGAIALAVFLVLYLIGRGSLGEADVKLAPGFGLLLGTISVSAIVNWLLLTFLAAGAYAVIALILRKVGPKDFFAFAPSMFLAAITVFAVSI